MRIDKAIASTGYGTRSEVRKLISAGLVSVNGIICKNIGESVEDSDIITVNNETIQNKEHLYYLIDKPDCVLTAMEDSRLKTVSDYIPERLKTRKISPVGRLDYHTTGLLILTNDGELSHRLTSPKYEIPKRYLIEYEGDSLTDNIIKEFEQGITLTDKDKPIELSPAKLELLDSNHCLITITEGKTHQIRRMISHYGRSVVTLRRLSIGKLSIEDGKQGELIELTEAQINHLKTITRIN